MRKHKIYELFPEYENFSQISNILRYALECAEKLNHSTITMSHIIYGYLFSCNNIYFWNDLSFRWRMGANKYIIFETKWSSDYVMDGIDKNVYDFSKYYNYFCQNNNMTLRIFYNLIVYLCKNEILVSNFTLPYSHIEDKDYKYIDIFVADSSLNTKNSIVPIIDNSIYAKSVNIQYTRDITNLAYNHKLNTFVGREKELARLITVLSRMIKNNAIIIGNPGVGKTSIVEALAMKLVKNDVPISINNYCILELNLGSALSGTKYRGDFEERINKLINSIKNSMQKIILFIDEIQLIVGMGNSDENSSSISLSDMLKPIFLDPNVRIVGTSTFKDFKKIEKDKALERRMDTITIEETTFDETLSILENRKDEFENNFGLEIPTSTLKDVINLSQKYIPEHFLPDKALNLLDDACATKVNSSSRNDCILKKEDIVLSISSLKNIPIDKLQNTNNYSFLMQELNEKVIGQSHAIETLVNTIRRTQVGLNDENRPLGAFLFVGPTGVGKTEMAKVLADFVFSGRDNIIKFDMSEFMEEHSVSKLIGSPPGYVGYNDGGLLTDSVRRHPYSLVLFDEIEKAHPKIWNLLLQILDEGILTDSHGEKINFKNTIIILTSNTGAKGSKHAGFGDKTATKSQDFMSAVKDNFSPELLNRLDEIILFNNLTETDIARITKLYINNEIIAKLNSKNISIDISDDVINELSNQGYNAEYGARELKRTITKMLKNPLVDFLIRNPNATKISIKMVDGELKFFSNELICL